MKKLNVKRRDSSATSIALYLLMAVVTVATSTALPAAEIRAEQNKLGQLTILVEGYEADTSVYVETVGMGRTTMLQVTVEDDTSSDFVRRSYGPQQIERVKISTYEGNDLIQISAPVDTVIRTRGGHDEIYANHGNDVIFSGDGHDVIFTEAGNDIVYSGAGDDDVDASCSDPTILTELERKEIYGEAGEDDLLGSLGVDIIRGGRDDDFIFSYAGDDEIHGDEGDDWMYGGAGRDYVAGGRGLDWLSGGDAPDMIVFDIFDRLMDSPLDYIASKLGLPAFFVYNVQSGEYKGYAAHIETGYDD